MKFNARNRRCARRVASLPRLARSLLLGLLVASPLMADPDADASKRLQEQINQRLEQIAQKHNPDPSTLASDVGAILHDARQWRGYGSDCNMEHLGVRQRKVAEAHMNLVAMRASTMGTIMEMAANLREIFAGMESMFPGGPTAYDALMKPTQAALGKLGPYGQIAKGVTEVLDNYKDWHNSEVAKDLAADVKAAAKRQMDALKEALDLLEDIETATDEVERMLDTIQQLMQTYPQRCLKGQPITPQLLRVGETSSWSDIEGDLFSELNKPIDDCDLEALINRLAYLNQMRGLLESQLEATTGEMIAAFNALNAELAKFEGQLPKYEMKDFVKLLKSGEGIAKGMIGLDKATQGAMNAETGEYTPFTGGADFSGSTPSEFLPLEEIKGAMDKAKAADKLKQDANKKLEALKELIKKRDAIMSTLLLAWAEQRRIQRLIETWEERCLKEDDDSAIGMGSDGRPVTGSTGTTGTLVGGTGIPVATDSPLWCTYREGNPETTTPGGGTTPPGSSSGTTPPPGSSSGSAPPPGSSSGTTPPGGGTPPGSTPRKGPCPDELRTINQFLEEHGAQLREEARTNTQKQQDLDEIMRRKRELETECPEGSDPRDTGGPGSTTTGGPTITSVPRDPDDEDPRDTGEPTVVIYVKAKAAVSITAQVTSGQQIKLFARSTTGNALPGPGVARAQTDHDQDPIQGVTDGNGNATLRATPTALGITVNPNASGTAFEIAVDTTAQSSLNARTAGDPNAVASRLPGGVAVFVSDVTSINGQGFITFTFPSSMLGTMQTVLVNIPGIVSVQINFCRDKQASPDDPLFQGNRAWGQKYDNQWALKRVGVDRAWNKLGRSPQPVTVAVIDTGLDWNHLDINWDNLWQNPGEVRDNGIDDDGNGFVDDIIGWDFFGRHNNPWDHDGHGTFVAGVIAAATDNGVGIAGINPHARIMVLKALNSFGHSRASYLARAIVYAVDNGAQVINMSVGGKEMSDMEIAAIEYANEKDVLVIVAAGNEGLDVSNYGIAGLPGVITVAATDLDDRRAGFSNWGAPIDIAAPGLEVLSLRARRTDTMRDIPGVEYVDGANYVGEDRRYYRASGTSFSAPIVAGVASMLLSRDPQLGAAQVKQILLQSAQDLEVPGIDQYTGYGMVDALAALQADADYFIESGIERVEVVQEGGATLVRVLGTADADRFDGARLELGQGEAPTSWKPVAQPLRRAVESGVLGDIDAANFAGAVKWTIRVITTHKNGKTREAWYLLELG
tara:strand:- start:2406 stop:6152 length:3747 start_codon:yes stop_codon:yes gene_type:complete